MIAISVPLQIEWQCLAVITVLDVSKNAEDKRRRKKVPLLVANRAQDALGNDENEVTLLDDAGSHPLPRMTKLALARTLVAELEEEPHTNPNTRTREFSLRDPDGYYVSISELALP